MVSKRTALWGLPLLVYLVFAFWYTGGGPLTTKEIDDFTARMRATGTPEQRIAFLRKFMEEDSGRQLIMLNNVDKAESPPNVEGAEPGESASQLMGRYMEHMWPAMLSRASHPVYAGKVVFQSLDILGIENVESWDSAGLVRYRSRRDLMEIATDPIFESMHDFKVAALDKTFVYPVEGDINYSDLRFVLALVLFSLVSLLDLLLYRRGVSN